MPLSKNLRLFTNIILTSILTGQLMHLCLNRLPPVPMPNRCISMGTFVTRINLPFSRMGQALFNTFYLLMIRISNLRILTLPLKRKPILPMKITLQAMLPPCSLSCRISFLFTPFFIRIHFLAILLLIPSICTENRSMVFTFPKHLFL